MKKQLNHHDEGLFRTDIFRCPGPQIASEEDGREPDLEYMIAYYYSSLYKGMELIRAVRDYQRGWADLNIKKEST